MIRQVQRGSGLIRRDEMPGFRVEMPHWGEGGYRDGCAVTNRYFPILEPGKREDQERPPGGGLFRLRRVTWKSRKSHHPQVTKGACSWFGPPSSGSLTPTKLRGPAPNGHPCPSGALAASMPLGPLRVVCVRPAPKSRLAVFEPLAYEDQKQIKSRSKADRGRIRAGLRAKDTGGLVGVSLLTKALAPPPNNWCLKCSIREQAHSHKDGGAISIIVGAWTGLFPAKAGPTNRPRAPVDRL